jgi:hypothetical protein
VKSRPLHGGTCRCAGLPRTCVCGLSYAAFRSPDVPSFGDTYRAVYLASVAAVAEQGDYSIQARRRGGILGRMHEAKVTAWREHLHWCELQAQAEAVPF